MFLTSAFIDRLQADLSRDLRAFGPELILCAAIVLSLLLRMFGAMARRHLGYFATAAAAAALGMAICQWQGGSYCDPGAGRPLRIFAGMLIYDPFGIFVRMFLLAFAVLVLVLCLLTGIPDRDDAADFSTLLLGGTLGMMMMAAANHLLMVFVAVEMASVPSYALAGFLKGRKRGSEAALKYVVYGASASGIMLYGISLLAGRFGTGLLPDVALGFQAVMAGQGVDSVLAAGTLLFVVGLGFKLAAVPFHFWCPDVFEGAAAEVAAFLSVASKGAALALTARVFLLLAGPPGNEPFTLLRDSLGLLLAFIAALTATFGNLAALGQTNLKRLLAYSTIAHAGYMLMALAPLTAAGAAAVLFYLPAYLLMNLGAFACVAFFRNLTGSEDLAQMPGMIYRAPFLVVAFALFLLSLLGLPPLAGFAAKFQIFAFLFDSGRQAAPSLPMLGYVYYGLLIVAGINTVVSAGYYLKVLRVMVLDPPGDAESPARQSAGPEAYTAILAALIVLAFVFWNPLNQASRRAADSLLQVGTVEEKRPPHRSFH